MNSKYAYLSALIILAILVSGVSATDNNLIKKSFGNKDFKIDIPSDSNFNKEATTRINIGNLKMNMDICENKGDSSKDLSMILYLNDSSSKENILPKVINDLKKDGDIIEENDNYLVVKNKDSKNFNLFNFNLEDAFNGLINIIKGIFLQDGNINVTTDNADIQVSNDGINIADSNNNNVSISGKGLEVSDNGKNVSISGKGLEVSDNGENVSISGKGLEVSDDGENVSISKNGVKVSGNESDNQDDDVDDDVDEDKDEDINEDTMSNIEDAEYSLYIKNKKGNQLIVLVGNNLDLMKAMADTASFK